LRYVSPVKEIFEGSNDGVGFGEPRIIVLSSLIPRVATNDENEEETRRWGKNDGERKRRNGRLLYICMLFELV